MTTVLITGFGRFPDAPSNPSGPLAVADGTLAPALAVEEIAAALGV